MSKQVEHDGSDDVDRLFQAVVVGLRDRVVPEFPHPQVDPPRDTVFNSNAARSRSHSFVERKRTISRITGYGVAAAVLLAVGSAVLYSLAPGITLAQVVQTVREHQYCSYVWLEVNKNTDGLGPEINEVTTKRVVYVDLQRDRFRTEMATEYDGNPYTFVDIQDLAEGEQLMINPQQKKATLILRQSEKGPRSFLQRLEAMEQDPATETFTEQVDGADVLGYRLTDPHNRSLITIWVDPTTRLPVKMTQAMPELKIWYSMTDFVWNPTIADGATFFALKVPDGFDKVVIDKRQDPTE